MRLVIKFKHTLIYFKYIVKASYYRLARKYHPDRVPEEEKLIANDKFSIVHQAYSILANPETKKLYDSGETHVLFSKPTIAGKWEQHIRPVTSVDIENARNKYQGTIADKNDVVREFLIGKGSMTHLFNTIPFMRYEDESRIIHMIKECMETGAIKKIPIRKMRL